jgi:hypothetical protein
VGLNSNILVVGKYKDMPNCVLDYPDDYYANTYGYTIVFGTIGECNTSQESRDLAEMCNVDIWDFNTHHITKEPNLPYDYDERFLDWYGEIVRCLKNGLDLYFQPNG